jgi:GH35 family endo-1,4-beta-xylanase
MAALLTGGATAWSADAPALKDAFKDHFLVGTAVNRAIVNGTGFRRSSEQVSNDIALIKQQFNQVVAENDMKWALIPEQPQLLYQGRDPSSGGYYELLPYRLGLLSLDAPGRTR